MQENNFWIKEIDNTLTINIAYHVGVVQKLFSPKSSLAEEKRIQSINQSIN